jgi:flagellar motor component MotA
VLSSTQLIALYPRTWRERYGDEFAALLEDFGIGPRTILDVLLGAFDAHIRQRASDRAAARAQSALILGGKITMGTIVGVGLAVLVWAFAVTIEGGRLVSYLLPSPILLVVGGALAALLIGYGVAGVAALPGLFGLVLRGPASVTGEATAAAIARYRLGRDMFRDAGHFALLSGVVATLLGLIIVLNQLASAGAQLGHHLAASLSGFLYGFVVAIFCYALSANLRHKGEQVDGTLRAVEQAAAGLDTVGESQRPAARTGALAAPVA